MPQITRTWLAFAALGAGMIHLAMVISSPLPLAISFALLGVIEFGWGVLTFARDDIIAPRAAAAGAIIPAMAWSLLVVASTLLQAPWIASSITLLPMAIATGFELFAAAVISRHLRQERTADDVAPPIPSAGRYLLALGVGGILVGALTTPALAATEAGRYAQPHGEHSAQFVPADEPDETGDLADLVNPEHQQH